MTAASDIPRRIAQAGVSIYDPVPDDLLYPLQGLEARLRSELIGLNLDYPIRTRSKVAKTAVALALGYPVPETFARSRPRFPGQNLDVYVQQSDNVQVWNEEVAPDRRYAFLRTDVGHRLAALRVITGQELALLDNTGTLTSKYQARRRTGRSGSVLVTPTDTPAFISTLRPGPVDPLDLSRMSASDRPVPGAVFPIAALHKRLLTLIGNEVEDPGTTQERLRGVALQRLAVPALGLGWYADAGQFPDVLCQALELKLQTSPTIDLGLVAPDHAGIAQEVGDDLAHRDVRYAVAYAERIDTARIRIAHLVVTTGAGFFSEFQRFEGRVRNQKLQIRLPAAFFSV